MVQDGGVEGNALIFSCESTKITTSYRKPTDRRTLELTRKRYSCPKTKEKLQQDSRRGAITIKSNPISAGWATHRLEKNNTKKVVKVLSPHQTSQPGDQVKGLWIPRESDLESQWRDLITELAQGWKKQRLHSRRAQTKSCVHQDPGERRSDPEGNWSRPTC